MAEALNVIARENRGKHNMRRLRRSGQIPAVLYGHGLENVCLAVAAEQFQAALRHGSRLVSLTGAVDESAFIRELQWDTYGTHVVHIDFTRISEHELVRVELTIELRGEAPGVKEGGVVEHLIHSVEIECPASAIPDKLHVNVNHMKLNAMVKLGDLELPENSRAFGDPEAVVVQCVVPVEKPEEEVTEAVPGEPEVIGAKPAEEEEES
ncbi:MAG: 50S ribosomal protein L25 [Thermoguttaceae bacterium]|jgi:large subunit ribosomal protein L25